MINATLAIVGRTEVALIVMDAAVPLGVSVVALVGFWLWRRGKRAPPAQGPHERHTTLIDF